MRAIDAFAEHIPRHQEIAGKDVGLALDDGHGFRPRVDTSFIAIEVGLPVAVQNEMTELVGDGKTLALCPGRTVVENAPFGGIVRIAYQRPLAARPRRWCRGLDLLNASSKLSHGQ